MITHLFHRNQELRTDPHEFAQGLEVVPRKPFLFVANKSVIWSTRRRVVLLRLIVTWVVDDFTSAPQR